MSGDVTVLETTGFMRLRWLITPDAALCTHGFYTNSTLVGGFNQNERIKNVMDNRCDAAHEEDTRECVGDADGVIVIDRNHEMVTGCVLHTAVALRSLMDGRVQAGAEPGAATAAYRLAKELEPFAWRGQRNRERAEALYRWHVRQDDDGRKLCRHDDYDGQGCHWRYDGETCQVADLEIGEIRGGKATK